MDEEKLATLRYNCLLLARPNESDRRPEDVIAAATAYFDFVMDDPVEKYRMEVKTDDEIPF